MALCLAALFAPLHVAATPGLAPPRFVEPGEADWFPEADADGADRIFAANPFDAYDYEANQWSDPFPPYPRPPPAPPRFQPAIFASPRELHGPRVLILPSSNTGSLPYPRPVLTNPNDRDRDSDSSATADPCSIPSAPPLRSRSFMLESLAREVADAMDFSTEPCDNFYRYACGGWLDKNNVSAIPPDVSSWSKSSAQVAQTGERRASGG